MPQESGTETEQKSEEIQFVSISLARKLSETWTGRLAHYRSHRNDEHASALLEETTRYVGLYLENDLCRSEVWAGVQLWHTATVVLFLIDRGVVERAARHGQRVFEPLPHAESWVSSQPRLRNFRKPMLELLSALRYDLSRRTRSRQP